MRLVTHDDPNAALPPRKPVSLVDLAWMRRERADSIIRRAIGELRALAIEDTPFTAQYRSMADAFESALALIDAIETYEAN